MTTSDNLPAVVLDLPDVVYDVEIHKLKSGGRRDVLVHNTAPVESIDRTGIVDQLRAFFDAIEREATWRKDDPISTVQALAKVEAMLADLRYVRDSIQSLVATALHDQRIRRLTVDGCVTAEASTDTSRTGWEHAKLTRDVLRLAVKMGRVPLLSNEEIDQIVNALLRFFTPDWRLTPLRESGLNPDDYSEVSRDEEGNLKRRPTVRIVDNLERRARS